ncbi:Rrf2 family transcriptional regulator [Sporolactobacillus kofuensis]|uniref:Rrf2 family transcriptional regulator n=1 Tax=Sporolactobacillus kofuensis TaxID=269672 RepID=A0ABW1WH31_9BACL|nr:Rrf2 family transcriptional regulator [Sporolactobacillus kofuensis]MCO7175837.1 Rrf2 family transcriptional regulator [Sporolactobacillus kofuensis]
MNSQFTIAVHCLIVLAKAPEQVWNSESLSQKVHTHPARIRKIMSILRKSGLVETKEGLGGGYRMGCDPHKCTLARIYQSISCNPLKLSWCSSGCDQDLEYDKIQSIMDFAFTGAERGLEDYLEQWSIDSLLQRMDTKAENWPEILTKHKLPTSCIKKEKEMDRHINKIGGEG